MDFKSTQTIYRQIEHWVYEQILSGVWKPGERAKSVRELAVAFEVNPNTVMRSYERLQNQEIITNKRGIGFFVNEDASEKIHAIRKKEFMEEEVPEFLKNMRLLGITMEDVMAVNEK
ncbi:MAG: GntR family transcriptional regulator [Bacteroidales bacterium]|nr:GntR family transcriptional regulator [Bacteroidales bacterium]